MGCTSTRSTSSVKELKISTFESLLNYSSLNLEDIDFIHRKFSYAGVINDNHWHEITSHLAIPMAKASVKLYFEKFHQPTGYNLTDMLTLGFLLGTGKGETRAKLLFEAFDSFDQKYLEKEKVSLMFDTMFDISVVKVREIIRLSDSGHSEKTSSDEFLEKISSARKSLKKDFIKNIIGDNQNCTLEGFINTFRDDQKSQILTSSGLRNALKIKAKKDRLVIKQVKI